MTNILESAGFKLECAGGNCTAYMRRMGVRHCLMIQEAFDVPFAPFEDGPCFVALHDDEVAEIVAYREVENFAAAVRTIIDLSAQYGADFVSLD